MDLYDILGIKKGASQQEVKKAYKSKAQKTHPDKEGGSQEKFNDVQFAFEVLGDEERRKTYDETGESGESFSNLDEQAADKIVIMFMGCINTNSSREKDYPVLILNGLKEEIRSNKVSIKRIEQANKKMESIKERIICDDEKQNLLEETIEKMLYENRHTLEDFRKKQKVAEIAIERIKKYGMKDMSLECFSFQGEIKANEGYVGIDGLGKIMGGISVDGS